MYVAFQKRLQLTVPHHFEKYDFDLAHSRLQRLGTSINPFHICYRAEQVFSICAMTEAIITQLVLLALAQLRF